MMSDGCNNKKKRRRALEVVLKTDNTVVVVVSEAWIYVQFLIQCHIIRVKCTMKCVSK